MNSSFAITTSLLLFLLFLFVLFFLKNQEMESSAECDSTQEDLEFPDQSMSGLYSWPI